MGLPLAVEGVSVRGMGILSEADALRAEAQSLRVRLRQTEMHDWPRWLREADGVTREICELLRRAAELERSRAA